MGISVKQPEGRLGNGVPPIGGVSEAAQQPSDPRQRYRPIQIEGPGSLSSQGSAALCCSCIISISSGPLHTSDGQTSSLAHDDGTTVRPQHHSPRRRPKATKKIRGSEVGRRYPSTVSNPERKGRQFVRRTLNVTMTR